MSETAVQEGTGSAPATEPAEAAAPAPTVVNNIHLPSTDPSPTPALRAIDIVRRRSRAARRKLVIPEWEDLTLWFGTLTVADMETVGNRLTAEKREVTSLERNIVLVIVKAENEDGTPVFAMGDLHLLKQEASFKVIQRTIDFMFEAAAELPTPAGEADRIAADPNSASA